MLRRRPLIHEIYPLAGSETIMTVGGEAPEIMAVYYKVYQDNRERNPHKGCWYGRAAMIDTDTTEDLAKQVMEKCTVNEADVLAVIKALVSEITRSLQASHRVKLPGFGTFKIGMRTTPAETRDKFTADNVKEVHVLFQPEVKIGHDGVRTRAFLTGTRVKELTAYDGNDKPAGTKAGGSKSDSGNAGGSDAGSGKSDAGSGKSDAGNTGGSDQGASTGDGNGGHEDL